METSKLLLSDSRGVYIPRDFAQDFRIVGVDGVTEAESHAWRGIEAKDVETLQKGPEEEWYWEAWDSVLNDAYYVDSNGTRWTLHQNGDLWAVAWDEMTEEEKENFQF